MATQLGNQLNPTAASTPPQPSQAYYAPRSSNNNRGSRGNSRGSYRGNYRNNTARNRETGSSRQFSWASTQNTVYGHCNHCGIGHLPSQCPNQSSQPRTQSQANYATHSDAGSHRSFNYLPDTGANDHAATDFESLDNSEAYYGRVYTHHPPNGSK
ncbi:uncharacterized protein LOC110941903 [Helianthus annuus]|uniref:uncharacterized protein LOC110941903 n=1 Tax=Helianthus annuus TaxID=4232 RepID=UPI001652C738|nr:uncharacterized protein LOC110941903 [Helianthus annuus]